jgi:hypothetical protein
VDWRREYSHTINSPLSLESGQTRRAGFPLSEVGLTYQFLKQKLSSLNQAMFVRILCLFAIIATALAGSSDSKVSVSLSRLNENLLEEAASALFSLQFRAYLGASSRFVAKASTNVAD